MFGQTLSRPECPKDVQIKGNSVASHMSPSALSGNVTSCLVMSRVISRVRDWATSHVISGYISCQVLSWAMSWAMFQDISLVACIMCRISRHVSYCESHVVYISCHVVTSCHALSSHILSFFMLFHGLHLVSHVSCFVSDVSWLVPHGMPCHVRRQDPFLELAE